MAVVLSGTFLLLALVGRVIIQIYHTGNHGIRFANPVTEPLAAIAGTTFLLSFSLSILFIALDYLGVWQLERLEIVSNFSFFAVAIGFFGILITLTAQWQMRDEWRIGVDQKERTALVTHGLYSKSRNPIYFGIFLYWVGLAGALPHPVILILGLVCWVSIEVIVREVEEPYLRSLHGANYERYFEQTNRYVICGVR